LHDLVLYTSLEWRSGNPLLGIFLVARSYTLPY
jgi:hypothetical protein